MPGGLVVKKFILIVSGLLSVCSFGFDCKTLIAVAGDTDAHWRNNITHPTATNISWKSDSAREQDIKNQMKHQTDEHNGVFAGHPDTPPMVVVPVKGTVIRFTKDWEEYKNMQAEVTGTTVQDGILRATILLPVSGHTGLANARNWAKTDTYSLFWEDAKGKRTTIVKDAKSLDMITLQDIEVPLKDGEKVTLYYERSGSLGVDGYQGGRALELTWKKNDLNDKPVDTSKPFWIKSN